MKEATRLHPKRVFLSTLALASAWPLMAWGHVGSGQAGGFLSGLSHPVSGLDHVIAMVAVGLWGAQLGMPALWEESVQDEQVFPRVVTRNLGR